MCAENGAAWFSGHHIATKPARKVVDIFPPLPIIISVYCALTGDNVVAALERKGRICKITIGHVPSSLWEKFLAEMQGPFPALTDLCLHSKDEADKGPPVVSDWFLGGSAPHLPHLDLSRVQVRFPGLTKLPLSPTHLITLRLSNIPHSGYISGNRSAEYVIAPEFSVNPGC
jgi:hypothetical protein